MEFKITNPIDESGYLKAIEFNFDEMKTELTANLEKYRNLIITEDKTKEAKADRAKLNSLKTAIENKRKEIKKLCLEPYNNFEIKVKELVALIDEPILQIDTQIKKYEEQEKNEKKKLLKDYFNSCPNDPEVAEFVTFDDFIKNREQLLNKSYNLNNAYAEIENWLNKILEHLCIMKDFADKNGLDYAVLKLFYKDNGFDFAKTIEYQNKLKAEQDKILEGRTSNIPENLQVSVSKVVHREETKRVEFWCEVTPTQAKLMQKFLKENNIKYGAIKG